MYRVLPSGRSRRVRTLLIAVALLGLLGASLPIAQGIHSSASAAAPAASSSLAHDAAATPSAAPAAPTHAASPAPSSSAAPSAPAAGVHPASSSAGSFWSASNQWFVGPSANDSCSRSQYLYPPYDYLYYSYCGAESVSPSVVTLANGNIGVAYSISTNLSSTQCAGGSNNVTERIGFSISANGGDTFSPLEDLGNETCAYLDAIEPSFAVSSAGVVDGVYVEYNNSTVQNGAYLSRTTSAGSSPCCNNTDDGLAFTYSSDNGTTFSAPMTINHGGNISKPQIALFGDTIYVLYENISNGTTGVSWGLYGNYAPSTISENLMYSTNGGVTWSKPISLPGQNSTNNYNAMGGSIAVNAAGLVGVALLHEPRVRFLRAGLRVCVLGLRRRPRVHDLVDERHDLGAARDGPIGDRREPVPTWTATTSRASSRWCPRPRSCSAPPA